MLTPITIRVRLEWIDGKVQEIVACSVRVDDGGVFYTSGVGWMFVSRCDIRSCVITLDQPAVVDEPCDAILPTFVESMHDKLEEFYAYWETKHEQDPERFPWAMGADEWSHQMDATRKRWETEP